LLHELSRGMTGGWPTLDRAYSYEDKATGSVKTVDSAGSFLVNELERLDPTLHMPLAAVTWSRDIDLREDVTIADESASFTNSTAAAAGGVVPAGINWGGKVTTAIAGISLDISKTSQPLPLWEMELKYSIPELESAIKVGRPIDQQKFEFLNLKHQMDIDQVVYMGDVTTMGTSFTGMFNNTGVTATTAATGAALGTKWSTKTPAEMLADVNTLLNNTWAASGYSVIPDRLLIPPAQYSILVSQVVSTAGSMSILKFLEENNLAAQRGGSLDIYPVKWAIGMGAGGTPGILGTVDRALAYSKDPGRLRYPMTPLQKTPIQYVGIYHVTTYYCRLGQDEFIYPSTFAYLDGI
jgi:hypothetical protein